LWGEQGSFPRCAYHTAAFSNVIYLTNTSDRSPDRSLIEIEGRIANFLAHRAAKFQSSVLEMIGSL
jgi:hypothetical protein